MDGDTMFEALRAEGPDPALAERLMLFGQFVGAWDLQIMNTPPGGPRSEVAGEVHFAWGLEGRAVVDVWIAPRRALRDRRGIGFYGTTVRFFDPAIDAWRSTWLAPTGTVMPFIGRRIGEEIVLEGRFEAGKTTRWIFSDIAPARFRWRAVESGDGGATWVTTLEMDARRADQ